ncbi:MAG: DUF481 domain-containing protein, partial [Deltaproteobacteria bacterium]|nr:DUF481 domain-containing protein [Deltaproteobacteria bacterium]
ASGRLRRGDEQLTGTVAVNYARAAVPPSRSLEPTVENYQGRFRFDHFLGGGLAAFLSTTARRDRFQGLDLRLNVDPGAAYYFLDEKAHQAWVELGYDLQFDLRNADAVAAAEAAGEPVDDSKIRHNARLYLGYQNTLSESVAFTAGLEVLQGISETDASRVNGDLALTSKIAGRFSLATTFALKYDSKPLPDVQNVDTMTAVNLVYQLL